MAPRRWTSQEAQEFVNTFYSKYQTCQATKDYNISLDQDLDMEQKIAVNKAYERRKELNVSWHQKLVNLLRNDWGTSKASRKAKNNGDKAGRDAVASIIAACQSKGVQSLNKYEAYSKLFYASRIKPVVDTEMKALKLEAGLESRNGGGEWDDEDRKDVGGSSKSMQKKPKATRVAVTKRITREIYGNETPEVKAEVTAYIKQINDEKAQLLEGAEGGESLHSPSLAFRTIDRLVDILTEFFQELQHLTGWSFLVLMGGPTPALGGKFDVSSFHVGHTVMGSLFLDAHPNFNTTAAAKTLMGGVQEMNEAIDMVNITARPDDVSVSHSTSSDALTSTLVPPLDSESEQLRGWRPIQFHLVFNAFASFTRICGPSNLSLPHPSLPPPLNHSSTLPSSGVGDPYDFTWSSTPLPPSQGIAGPSNLPPDPPLIPYLMPFPPLQGSAGPSGLSSLLSPNPPLLPLHGGFTFPQASTVATMQPTPVAVMQPTPVAVMRPTQADTSCPVINTVIQTSPAVAMTAPHATVCDILQTLLKQQSKPLTHTAQPAISPQTSALDTILPQALSAPHDLSPPKPFTPTAQPAISPQTSALDAISPQVSALPGLSPPGLEEPAVSRSDQPVEVPDSVTVPRVNSQKHKNVQDKGSVELPAEPPVMSRPKHACIESRRNEIANSIGQEKTTEKKSKAQK
ncbi:hypothetical protein F4604DRAFT_1679567 [Suillus subluteus]|nr:hypothetical protein F4604DRAFT_1679567 [Suillus subluteus]